MMPSKSDSDNNCSSAASDTTKKNLSIAGIVNSILLLGALFGFLILNSHNSSMPSPHVLLEQLSQLNRDLISFESLKQQYVEDEIQLGWDNQRISELEHNIQSMRTGFETSAHFFLQQKHALQEGNKQLQRAISDSSLFNDEQREHKTMNMSKVSEELAKAHDHFNREQSENFALKKMLADMQEEIEKEKRLRGVKRIPVDARDGTTIPL